ncbi:MAG: PAS domain S-box protein, partial [Nitrospinales bacterium]
MEIESKRKYVSERILAELRPQVGGPADASRSDGRLSGMGSGENSEERFYQLLESFQMYFFFTRGLNGEFSYVCDRVTRLLGCSPDEFRAHWKEYLAQNLDNKEGLRRFEAGIWSKESDRYEVELLHRQGHSIWLDIFESPVLDDAG